MIIKTVVKVFAEGCGWVCMIFRCLAPLAALAGQAATIMGLGSGLSQNVEMRVTSCVVSFYDFAAFGPFVVRRVLSGFCR